MIRKNNPFIQWIFTISFILITFVPRSLDDTMFMDGLVYASIARNMAIGEGNLFQPYFADSFWLPYDNDGFFYGHPPLQFGLEALLFRGLGDSTMVENIYNLLVLLATILLIAAIWRQLFKGTDLTSESWLPVLCWYSMLIVWYAIPNNFLDSTMAVFCLLSSYLQLRAVSSEQSVLRKRLFLVLAGVSIFLSVMTKGPVGLYPLAFAAIYILFYKKGRIGDVVRPTFILIISFLVPLLLILCYKPALFFFSKYFQGQVVQALLQKRERVGDDLFAHLYLLKELGRSIWPHAVAVVVLYASTYLFKIKSSLSEVSSRVALVCLIATSSVILPMLVSAKQYHHYLIPAMPIISLMFAALMAEKIKAWINFIPRISVAVTIVGTLCCWGILARKVTVTERHVMVDNALQIMKYVPRASTLGVCQSMLSNADIYAYMQRYHRISLSTCSDTTTYAMVNSECIDNFNKDTWKHISLSDDYFLVIRNEEEYLSKK
jgi:hypothetical protein